MNSTRSSFCPFFNAARSTIQLMKVDNPDKDLVTGPRGGIEPNPDKCKAVPMELYRYRHCSRYCHG